MQTKSWVLAAALALASTAVAEDRPRIYFPRNIKRQFFNTTGPPETPAPKTTRITQDSELPNGGGFVKESDKTPTPTDAGELILSDVITLTIGTTVVVPPTQSVNDGPTEPTEASSDNDAVPPTTKPGDEPVETPESTTSDEVPIVIAPTGVLTSTQSDEDSEPDAPADPTSTVVPPIGGGVNVTVDLPTPTDESNPPEETKPPVEEEDPVESTPIEEEVPAESTPAEEEVPVESTPVEEEVPVESTPAEEEVPVESTPAEEEVPVESTPVEEEEPVQSTPAEEEVPVESTPAEEEVPVESTPVEEEEPVVSAPAEEDPTDDVPIVVVPTPTEVIDIPTTDIPVVNVTDPIGNGTDPVNTVVQTEPPISEDPTPTVPVTTPVVTGDPTPTDGTPVDTTGGPGPTGDVTSPVVTEPVDPTGTPVDPSSDGTPTINPNSTVTDVPNSPTNAPAKPDTITFTSVPVRSTVTGTSAWLGTKLAADDATSSPTQELPAPTHSSETLPPGTPKTIDAQDEDVAQPVGSTLIRLVFDRRLHYEFVADNYTAAQQIFTYMPQIIGYGEGIDEADVKMTTLAPIKGKDHDWFPTGAFMYVPDTIIESLQANIHLPNSALYHHPYPVAYELASAINPAFGIFPGSENGNDGLNPEDPGGDPFTNNEEAPPEQTPQQQGATAGIAFGAVSVAVAYGAAMFIVARRYKRKKQAHRRASSISHNSSEMQYSASGSPAVMGGALVSRDFSSYGGVTNGTAGGRESHGSGRSGAGNSGRTAYISAPVAAENSLGWN